MMVWFGFGNVGLAPNPAARGKVAISPQADRLISIKYKMTTNRKEPWLYIIYSLTVDIEYVHSFQIISHNLKTLRSLAYRCFRAWRIMSKFSISHGFT